MKTVIIGVFVVASGVCYSLFFPRENVEISVVKGNTDVTSSRVTSTPVPTPTEKPELTGGASGSGNAGFSGSGAQAGKNGISEPTQKGGNTGTTAPTQKGGEITGLININIATAEELMSLPGIGQTRANSIIVYREQNGPFRTKEDIMLVKGIKDGVFSKIRDKICVE